MWIWRSDRNEPVWVGPGGHPGKGVASAPGLSGGGPGAPGKKKPKQDDEPVLAEGAYRYYRLRITDYETTVGYIELSELGLRETFGGAYATGGTASASSEYSGSFAAPKAFDGSDSTRWISGTASGGMTPPQWLKYDLGAGNEIALTEYVIQMSTNNATPGHPIDWTLEGSNDDVTWTVLDSRTGESFTQGQDRTFAVVTPEYGITAFTGETTPTSSTSAHRGWEFTVGANDLTVVALRSYMATADAITMRLYRVSDEALLAEAYVVDGTAGDWHAESVTPVVLSAGENYVVTVDYGGSGDFFQVASADVTFDDSLTYVQGRAGGDNAFPANAIADYLWGVPDLVFDVNVSGTGAITTDTPGANDATTDQQRGYRAEIQSDLTITGLRCWIGEATPVELRLWYYDAGWVLHETVEAIALADEWTEVALTTPLPVTAGTLVVPTVYGNGEVITQRFNNSGSLTYAPEIAYVQSQYGNGTGFPTSKNTSAVYGIADFLYTVEEEAEVAASYRYYRLNVTENNGHDTFELEYFTLHATSGGGNLFDSAGGTSSRDPAGLNAGHEYIDNGFSWGVGSATYPLWTQWDFGEGNDQAIPLEYTLRASGTGTRAPRAFTLEGSNDGSTWTVLDTVTGETGWTSNETRTFAVDSYVNENAHRYWRVLLSDDAGDGTYIGTRWVSLRTEASGAQAATGGTASASDTFSGYSVSEAFASAMDTGSLTNGWLVQHSGAWPEWVQYDFGEGNDVEIVEYAVAVAPNNNTPRAFGSWELQHSDDGTTWTTADTVTGEADWTADEIRVYTVGEAAATAYRYYRWTITADNGAGDICGFDELELRTEPGGANIATGGTASASSHFSDYTPDHAFDTLVDSKQWFHGSSAGHPSWIQYDLGEGNEAVVVEYGADGRGSGAAASQTPNSWVFSGSNDGVTWDDLHTATDQTWGSAGEAVMRTFTVGEAAASSATFHRYRLTISATEDGTAPDMSEIELLLNGADVAAWSEFTAGAADNVITSSSYSNWISNGPDKAFDDDGATYWDPTALPAWIKYDFDALQEIDEYSITPRLASNAPTAWVLEGTHDGLTWTEIDSQTGETSWTDGEKRSYTLAFTGDDSYTAPVTVEQYTLVGSVGGPFSGSSSPGGFGFSVSGNVYARGIEAYVAQTGDLNFSLGVSGGVTLRNSSDDGPIPIASTYTWTRLDFGVPVLLEPGTTYYVTLSRSSFQRLWIAPADVSFDARFTFEGGVSSGTTVNAADSRIMGIPRLIVDEA